MSDRLRVLIFHGYLLRGTGSNVYNASLARALARLGHEVHLLCQDRDAASLGWVGRMGTWSGGRLTLEDAGGAVAGGEGPGAVTVYVPDIGGLLPVYVYDRYEGFRVKTFPELTEDELRRYLEANVAAVRDVARSAGAVDAALANHLVMGPAILARAGLGFAAKIHGSALEFTVRPNPRFLPYAREGMRSAAGVLVGSRHTAESLWALLGDPDLPERTRLGPPGVDTELFAPTSPNEAEAGLRSLAAELEGAGGRELGRDTGGAAAAIERFAEARGPRVAFVGKFILSKGADLLLAAWPLVVRENPGASLLIVGFGEQREATERLMASLARGDLEAARGIAARWGEPEAPTPLRILDAFLSAPPSGYAEATRAAAGTVALSGRLEHDEVARLLPAADALVMPSTFPEAFGMVAAEAAACGALPVCAEHSGMLEVTRALAPALPAEARDLLSFPLGPGAVQAIADRLNRWLALAPDLRGRTREALARTARELWSWERVAEGVIAASRGRLDALPPVPADPKCSPS